jgi:hypothetical protein
MQLLGDVFPENGALDDAYTGNSGCYKASILEADQRK